MNILHSRLEEPPCLVLALEHRAEKRAACIIDSFKQVEVPGRDGGRPK